MDAAENENLVAVKLKTVEQRRDFKVCVHWTDNFLAPGKMSYQEFWEALAKMGKKFLESDPDDAKIWDDFLCPEWKGNRVHLSMADFHNWPHPGEVDKSDPDEDENTPLIDI